MSPVQNQQSLLAKAKQREDAYDWLGAASDYKDFLQLAIDQAEDGMEELYEAYTYALHRAAMQSKTKEEFRERTLQAISIYEKAGQAYERLNSPLGAAKRLRCNAMGAQLGFWLETDQRNKKNLLDRSWRATKEALDGFRQCKDPAEYARTNIDLALTPIMDFALEWEFSAREKIIREAIGYAEQASGLLSASMPRELARSYAILAVWLSVLSFNRSTPDMQESDTMKASAYWRKALDLSEESAMLEYSRHPLGEDLLGLGSQETLTTSEKILGYARKTQDRLVTGSALDKLAYHTAWWQQRPDDAEEAASYVKKALSYAEEAKQSYAPISFMSPRYPVWTEAPLAEIYRQLSFHETDLTRKLELLGNALERLPDYLRLANESGYPDVIGTAHMEAVYILGRLARSEKVPSEKRKLLQNTLEHATRAIEVRSRVQPFFHWNLGMIHGQLSGTLAELSRVTDDSSEKKKLLLESAQASRECLRLLSMQMPHVERTGSASMLAELAIEHGRHGDLLCYFHEVTCDSESLREAATKYLEAAKLWQRMGGPSRAAECYWKAAQVYNDLNEYGKASELFQLASQNYKETARKLPKHGEFYNDHASYMMAWNQVEKARHHHTREEYSLSEECYERAASLHASTSLWGFLSPNYRAWAEVENAEELSRKDKCEDAVRAFLKAEELFRNTKDRLQAQSGRVQGDDQQRMVARLIKAADPRQDYCRARVAIEEAKMLARKGDNNASSDRYHSAAETLEVATAKVESEQEKRDLRVVMLLAKAWRAMTKAEAESSPELYVEASKLFEQSKELCTSEKAKIMALGHSRFCLALEDGTRFADTGDAQLHAHAVDHLESAARYYLKAGYEKAAEYAEASKQLFDAYAYMDSAAKEKDAEKKTRLYTMAETVLQSSADLYLKSEHTEKREEVQRLLERVRKERQLTMSLMTVLKAPSIVSTTETFQTPLAHGEEPAGLERFAEADVQARLTIKPRNVWVGEQIRVELELVNTGRSSAQLLKLEGVLPQEFELEDEPDFCRKENGDLSMRGKRLDPLKTQRLEIFLKPKAKGAFTLKPRITYTDENGRYKYHQTDAVEIRVKELGFGGWLRGR